MRITAIRKGVFNIILEEHDLESIIRKSFESSHIYGLVELDNISYIMTNGKLKAQLLFKIKRKEKDDGQGKGDGDDGGRP